VVRQPAAEQGSHHPEKGSGARPGAESFAAFLRGKGRPDQGQCSGRQQSRSNALKGPAADQHLHVRSQAAGYGGDSENADADQKNPAASEPIARRAADEHQRAEHQQIGVGDPLSSGRTGSEIALDGGQSHAQRRAVDEGQAGPQNRGDQNPTLACGSERLCRREGALNLAGVAGTASGHDSAPLGERTSADIDAADQAFLAFILEVLH